MKEIVYKILWSTIEDFVGLWDVLWELNSVLPEKIHKENHQLADQILRYLLDQNLIKFYLNRWGNDNLEELESSEALKLLDEEKYWNPPSMNELCIKIGNTEKGQKYYNEELVDDFMNGLLE